MIASRVFYCFEIESKVMKLVPGSRFELLVSGFTNNVKKSSTSVRIK